MPQARKEKSKGNKDNNSKDTSKKDHEKSGKSKTGSKKADGTTGKKSTKEDKTRSQKTKATGTPSKPTAGSSSKKATGKATSGQPPKTKTAGKQRTKKRLRMSDDEEKDESGADDPELITPPSKRPKRTAAIGKTYADHDSDNDDSDKEEEEEEEEEADEGDYEVEKILHFNEPDETYQVRYYNLLVDVHTSSRSLLFRWKDFGVKADEWLPVDALNECVALLKKYHAANPDEPVPATVAAWIADTD